MAEESLFARVRRESAKNLRNEKDRAIMLSEKDRALVLHEGDRALVPLGNDKDVLSERDRDVLRKLRMIQTQKPHSDTLTKLYLKLKAADASGDGVAVLKYLTKLCYFALDHDVDIDRTWSEEHMDHVIERCLDCEAMEIKVAAMTFLVNVFRREHTSMLAFMSDERTLVHRLKDRVLPDAERDGNLLFACLQCLVNIANDSEERRDEVYSLFKPDFVFRFVGDGRRKVSKVAARLLWAYCVFPLPVAETRDMVDVIREALKFGKDYLVAILMRGWAEIAKTVEGAKLLGDKMNVELMENLIERSDDDSKLVCLVVLSRILQNGIRLEVSSFEKVMLWRQREGEMLPPEFLVCASLRLVANAVLVCPSLCGMLTAPGDVWWRSIENVIEKGNTAMKVEAIFLVANIVRAGSEQVIRTNVLASPAPFVRIFADNLCIEDPDVVDSVLCALARMIRSEASGGGSEETIRLLRDEYLTTIETLMDSSDAAVSEQASAFFNLFIQPKAREPFQFKFP